MSGTGFGLLGGSGAGSLMKLQSNWNSSLQVWKGLGMCFQSLSHGSWQETRVVIIRVSPEGGWWHRFPRNKGSKSKRAIEGLCKQGNCTYCLRWLNLGRDRPLLLPSAVTHTRRVGSQHSMLILRAGLAGSCNSNCRHKNLNELHIDPYLGLWNVNNLFIQRALIKHFLCASLCSRCWKYRDEHDFQIFCFQRF